MEDVDLKHYRLYLAKLAALATSHGIKLRPRRGYEDDGVYSPRKRWITYDSELDQSRKIAVILHELRHALDDLTKTPLQWKKIDAAYGVAYKKRGQTREQKLAVLACERRAWLYGENIAKRLRIPLGRWFFQVKEDCLSDYA